MILFGRQLLSIFNTNPTVIEYGWVRLVFILAFESLNVVMDVFSGSLRGYGRSLGPALIAVLGVCGTRIIWVFTVFRSTNSYTYLMAAYPISWAITAAAIVIFYFIMRRRIFKLHPSAA